MARVQDTFPDWFTAVSPPRVPSQYRDVPQVVPVLSAESAAVVHSLVESSGQRQDVPVRNSFVRARDDERPPLAALAARGGRGGAVVAIKLYVALLWRCSKEPFSTQVPSRTWARLLDLPDPSRSGARRVKDALDTLAELRLVTLEANRGAPSRVTLRREDGSDKAYSIPSEAYRLARSKNAQEAHRYFKVPQSLWTTGHIQGLGSAGTVMLLIMLEESHEPGSRQWWSVETFERRFRISKDVRAKGTKELVARRLLTVRRMNLPPSPGVSNPFAQDLVRNSYELINEALLPAKPDTP